MPKVTVHMSADQLTALKAELNRSGEPLSALVRRAIASHLAATVPTGRLQALRSARGLWKGRLDLPDPAALRREQPEDA